MNAVSGVPAPSADDYAAPAVVPIPWYKTRRGAFTLLVIVPTLLVLAYQLLVASPQYESKSAYVVRGMERDSPAVGGLAQLLGGSGAIGGAQHEAQSVRDFLLSPDAIAALKRQGIDVVALYNRADVDWLSRLRFARPRAETLLDYYQDHVKVDYDETESITRLSVRAFAPDDARKIATALIQLGEQRVNSFNQRAIVAGQEAARADLVRAEDDVARIQGELTGFRDLTGDIDPSGQASLIQKELERIEAELAGERANLATMQQSLAGGSPLVMAARSRVTTLERTASALQEKISGTNSTLTKRLSQFEELKLRQEFAGKRYEAARAALETARAQVERQRLFFVAVINPNQPERPVRPRPLRTTFAVFVALAVAFAIGWLMLAGIREHQAD